MKEQIKADLVEINKLLIRALDNLETVLNEPEPHKPNYADRLLCAKTCAEALNDTRKEWLKKLEDCEKSTTFAELPAK